jgi:hypothetical protein
VLPKGLAISPPPRRSAHVDPPVVHFTSISTDG